MMTNKSKVQINYRSGHSIVVRCDKFKVTWTNGRIDKIAWENVEPNPIFMGVSDVESVWAL